MLSLRVKPRQTPGAVSSQEVHGDLPWMELKAQSRGCISEIELRSTASICPRQQPQASSTRSIPDMLTAEQTQESALLPLEQEHTLAAFLPGHSRAPAQPQELQCKSHTGDKTSGMPAGSPTENHSKIPAHSFETQRQL